MSDADLIAAYEAGEYDNPLVYAACRLAEAVRVLS